MRGEGEREVVYFDVIEVVCVYVRERERERENTKGDRVLG